MQFVRSENDLDWADSVAEIARLLVPQHKNGNVNIAIEYQRNCEKD